MKLTAADFEKQYAAMSSDELNRLDRQTLGEVARECYDKEIAYRSSEGYRDKQLQAAAEAKAKALAETMKCFFCGSEPVSAESAAHIEMHTGYEQKQLDYRTTSHRWTSGDVLVARCHRCQRFHRTERNVRIIAAILSVPVFVLLFLLIMAVLKAENSGFVAFFGPVLWYGWLLLGSSILVWFLYMLPGFRRTKPIHHAYKSIAVNQALRDGWGKGPPWTFTWNLALMSRKFLGLVERPRARAGVNLNVHHS